MCKTKVQKLLSFFIVVCMLMLTVPTLTVNSESDVYTFSPTDNAFTNAGDWYRDQSYTVLENDATRGLAAEGLPTNLLYVGNNFTGEQKYATKTRDSYIKFDFGAGGIEPQDIESAVLRVCVAWTATDATRNVAVYPSGNWWTESNIKYGRRPEEGTYPILGGAGIAPLGSFNVDRTIDKWYEIDVTDYVCDVTPYIYSYITSGANEYNLYSQVPGKATFRLSVPLPVNNGTNGVAFYSTRHAQGGSKAPQLVITKKGDNENKLSPTDNSFTNAGDWYRDQSYTVLENDSTRGLAAQGLPTNLLYVGNNFTGEQKYATKTRDSYIKFDFGAEDIEPQDIESAVLRVCVAWTDTDATRNVAVYPSGNWWTESNIKYGRKPEEGSFPVLSATGIAPLGSFNVDRTTDKWYELDVTDYVCDVTSYIYSHITSGANEYNAYSQVPGKVTFKLSVPLPVNNGTNGAAFYSTRHAQGGDKAPQLVITKKQAASSASSYFGMATSGESMGDHARLYPELSAAGVSLMRVWPEWGPNYAANWPNSADRYLASANTSGMEITGMLYYLPAYASASGQNRTFPMSNIQLYRDYVTDTLTTYGDKVKYWEVYNEYNSSTFAVNNHPMYYAEMTREAYMIAQQINAQKGWDIKIGIGCADVAINFFTDVLKGGPGWSGAAGYIDFIAVHPYSIMDAAMDGRESAFLYLGRNLRTMLRDCGYTNPEDIPLWITEIGVTSDNTAAREQRQAEGLVKAYTLPLAQDFEKVFWFEGRGPDYGSGQDFGIIRNDGNWTKRPSYYALQTMTNLLGPTPGNLGWIDPGNRHGSYCFVFQGASQPVMVAWSVGASDTLNFGQSVTVTGINGNVSSAQNVTITKTPVFITGLPASWVQEAISNKGQPFSWFPDLRDAPFVSCEMGAENTVNGLWQLDINDGITVTEMVNGQWVRRTNKSGGHPYMYFSVDNNYVNPNDRNIQIIITACGSGGFNITHESTSGYRNLGIWTNVSQNWQTYTINVTDAAFNNNWGWNFRIDATGSSGDIYVKSIQVKRL